MSDKLISDIIAGMHRLAKLGEQFHRSAKKSVEQKKVEATFANWCNTLSNKLGGQSGDGMKEVLDGLQSDIVAVEDFLHEWKSYAEDKNYKETIDAVTAIRDELLSLKSLWLGASDQEKNEVLTASTIGQGVRKSGGFVWHLLILVIITLLITVLIVINE